MSLIINPYRFSTAAVSPSITYLDTQVGDGTGSTSESVTLDLGTAHAGDKLVFIIAHALWSGGGSVISSATLGGTSITDSNVFVNNVNEYIECFYYDDSGGSKGGSTSLALTFASAQAIQWVSAYRLTSAATGGPAASATDTSGNPTSTLSLNVLNNSMVVGGSFQRANSDLSMTWTGLTKNFEGRDGGGSYNFSSASHLSTGSETPRTVTAAWSSTGVRAPQAISASFSAL